MMNWKDVYLPIVLVYKKYLSFSSRFRKESIGNQTYKWSVLFDAVMFHFISDDSVYTNNVCHEIYCLLISSC